MELNVFSEHSTYPGLKSKAENVDAAQFQKHSKIQKLFTTTKNTLADSREN